MMTPPSGLSRPPSLRLSDDEILEIFRGVTGNSAAGKPASIGADALPDSFLYAYACALLCAPRRDFLILRPVSLLLIARYRLRAGADCALVHNFPGGPEAA